MSDENVLYIAMIKLIIYVQYNAAGITEDRIHTLFFETLHKYFCAIHLHVFSILSFDLFSASL